MVLSNYKGQNGKVNPVLKNTVLFTFEGAVGAIILNLANPFFSMFAKRMGAGDYQIGLITSVPSLVGIIALVPGALLVDRYSDKKKIVCLLILLTGIIYPMAAMTPFMGSIRVPMYIIFISLLNWPYSVFTISWQSFFSDVFADAGTNLAYANRSKASNLFGGVTALLGGLVLSYIPHTDGQRMIIYEIFFAASFGLALIQGWLLSRVNDYNIPQNRISGESLKTFLECIKMLEKNKRFSGFILSVFLFQITWQMAWPLFFLYQVDVLKANEAWISYISVASLVAGIITYSFWSRVVERKGAKLVLIIGALGLAINPVIMVSCKSLAAALILNAAVGLTFSGFQLALFECLLEVVPQENKTLNLAIYTTFVNIAGFVAPIMGVGIYKMTDINTALITSGILRFAATGLFLLEFIRSIKGRKST